MYTVVYFHPPPGHAANKPEVEICMGFKSGKNSKMLEEVAWLF
jgi:hypothetical protein